MIEVFEGSERTLPLGPVIPFKHHSNGINVQFWTPFLHPKQHTHFEHSNHPKKPPFFMDASKNRGKHPKMDGLFHGKLENPMNKWMIWGENPMAHPYFHRAKTHGWRDKVIIIFNAKPWSHGIPSVYFNGWRAQLDDFHQIFT